MATTLRSANQHPQSMQFAHFGILDPGVQSKSSVFTAVGLNVTLALIALIISAAAVKRGIERTKLESLTYVSVKPPEPLPKPVVKIVPPKVMPEIPRPVEPKIVLAKTEVMEAPKPVAMASPKPLPVVTPAPPKVVVAAAAPRPTTVNLGKAASVVNNDTHPTAVALGSATNPIAPSNRPATSAVNLGQRGLAGMPSSNSGGGPPASAVSLGSGQPTGSMGGSGARAVAGVKLGVTGGTPGGTGNGVGVRPAQVALGRAPAPPAAASTSLTKAPASRAPQVLYKPHPVYTADATAARVEGVVSVKIRVASTGAVSVVGVTAGLGHGLDQSAIQAVQGTRFKPAVDAAGNPVDWEGVVNISFQMAG